MTEIALCVKAKDCEAAHNCQRNPALYNRVGYCQRIVFGEPEKGKDCQLYYPKAKDEAKGR